jgi:signal transduction histidine kinase
MELTRRSLLVYALLAGLWVIILAWQVEEHVRVRNQAKTSLRNRSRDIANTLGAFLRGLQFRGAVFGDRLQPVLDELVRGDTNSIAAQGEVVSVALLNAVGETVAFAGTPIDLEQKDIHQEGERWGRRAMTVVYPVEGASVAQEGLTSAAQPVLLPPMTNSPRDSRGFRPRPQPPAGTNRVAEREPDGRPPPREVRPPEPDNRSPRPFWARRLNDQEYQSMIQKRELHGVVLALSTDNLQRIALQDIWLRTVILFFATVSVLGSSLAWRNLVKSSDLQIRLIRASELNSHLKEMNLAAAGLAHETRNPLNIIRGLAHMISRRPETPAEVQNKSREIIDEADKVAAQLNEFINYSRPREVRRSILPLAPVIAEVVRALSYDVEEKHLKVHISSEQLQVEADEQLLRQALFNLLLNAIQAVDASGEIQIIVQRRGPSEAVLDIRDNGPGVPPERRTEIFKPYVTSQKQGTGLGLAVVQQIVLAHGWDIQCLPNDPSGALFRISHLKTA